MTRRIGILGGTFDPIHNGHLDVASAAERALSLTRVCVIPANTPPHRPAPEASSFHRFAMAAIAVAGRRTWRASDLELRLDPATPSFTTTTLQRFGEHGYRPGELFFVIGADAFVDIETWRDYPRILDRANFAVVSRPGWSTHDLAERLPALAPRMAPPATSEAAGATSIFLIDAPTADVSSTAIRQRRKNGQSVAGLVPPGVQQHIEQHELYAPHAGGHRMSDAQSSPAAGRLHGKG